MAATGTIPIDDNKLTWTSPELGSLEQFETEVGPLTDMRIVNSVTGRIHLAHLCLCEKQPYITPETVRRWRAEHWDALWAMILEAVPIFQVTGGRRVPPAPPPADQVGDAHPDSAGPGSSTPTSPTAPEDSDGGRPKPDASA